MSACKRSHISVFLVLSALVFVAVPNLLRAQEERGTVKAVPLTVYAEMSADSDVVATLPPGKSVQITFSVNNGDGAWCKVASVDSSEKLGYVRCDGLDRQNAPRSAAAGSGTALPRPAHQTFENGTPTRAQERWALAASAILATFNREPLDNLSSGNSVMREKVLLQNWWGISNRDQLLDALEWIDRSGHRQVFSALGARAAKLSPDELSQFVSHLDSEDANSVMVAHRYYEKYAAQSITAWDYARYINLCRSGVAAGYLSEEEAWPRVMHAAAILQQTFTSWSEFGENYLVGREFWSLRQNKIDGQKMRAIYQRLLNDPVSPWNRIQWGLPLETSISTTRNLPGNPPGVQPAATSAGSSRCNALQRAATSGQASDVESMLQTEHELVNCRDLRGWTPLHYAAFNGQTKTLQILVAHGAAVEAADKDGATPLHAAATAGYPDTIEALLESGARVNALDHDDNTPLHAAASAGSVPATDALLRHHATLEKRGRNGFTPLHSAADKDQPEVAEFLIAHGAEINARTDAGDTPLHWAAFDDRMNAAALLLAQGAAVNPKDKDGNTPLHWAAARGHAEMTELLITHGADMKTKTRLGCTPLRGAYDYHQAATAQVLLQHGATQ